MKVAALDLGSNTFLLLIAEVENGKIVRVYHDECQVTRLAQGVDASREFHSEALARAKKCLDDYGKTIRQHRPARLLAVATSAARDAKNKDEFFNIAHEAGIPVKVISGVLEARLTFRGAVDDLVADRRCRVVDIGGGSTEYIVGGGEHQPIGQSLDMGCVRLTEKFISTHPVPEEELGNMRAAIRGQLDGLSEGIKRGVALLLLWRARRPLWLPSYWVWSLMQKKFMDMSLAKQSLRNG